MLLERDEVIEALGAALAGAADGTGGTVVVDGAAGLGKTAVLAEACAMAAGLGFQIRRAAGGELEQDLPWGVARDLLRRDAAGAPPVVRGAFGLGGAVPDDDLAVLQPLTDLCGELAEQQPLLLAVDDAHWADESSARLLAYLAGRAAELPLALVVASRPADPRRPAALDSLAARDGVHSLRLESLTPRALAELVRRALPGASDELCRSCGEATGGNHFLTVELARELAAADDPSPQLVNELAIERVDRALSRRLLAAGDDAARLARAVAVLGADADGFDAAALAELDPGAAARAADALRAAGLLDPGGPRLAFVHPLFRVAVERAIPPGQRSLIHLAAARHLDATGAPIERIGAQLLAVEPGGEPWVRDRLVMAADAAMAAGVPAIAKALLERAVAERTGPRDPDLLARLGRAALAVDPPTAVEPLRAAYEAATNPEQRVSRALELANALQGSRRFGDVPELLLPLTEELEAQGADAGLWWRVEAELLSQSYMDPGSHGIWRERLPRAAARLSGEHREEALVAIQLVVREIAFGRADRARELADELLRQGPPSQLVGKRDSPVIGWLDYALVYADAPERAEELASAWLREQRGRVGAAEAAYTHGLLAETQYRRGALREAEASAQAGWTAAREVGPGFVAWWIVIGTLAQALIARGRTAAARELLEREGVLEGPPLQIWLMPSPGVVRAETLLASGDTERGVEELLVVDGWLRSLGMPSPGGWWYPARLVQALLRLGRDDEAHAIATRWHDETISFGSPTITGMALRTLGLVERSLDHLEAGAALLAQSPARAEHALALVELGAALRRANRRTEAREPLREALDLAVRCGAEALGERVRAELTAAGGRPRRVLLSGPESLTPSELRVAQLAADGLSNPEIAAALYVTRKTVEKHLAAVYPKLGIGSRQELATALGR